MYVVGEIFMKPIYKENYIEKSIFDHLSNDINWLQERSARKEYFMSMEPLEYIYGLGINAKSYSSESFTEPVKNILDKLNTDFNCNYNVCFLNRYDNKTNALGWHADDSKEMNKEHSICVVSFGAEREIWYKDQAFKGVIPAENKQLLKDGSLYIMPAGFQELYFHRIPKSDKDVGIRISLTFRNYVKV